MNLGIFVNQAFYGHGNSCSTDHAFIKFIESFSSYFEKIFVFAPSRTMECGGHACYKCSNSILLCALPYYESVSDLFRCLPGVVVKTTAVLRGQLGSCDVLWLVGPHPLGLLAYKMAVKARVPVFYHVRGNILNDVKNRYQGVSAVWARVYGQIMHLSNLFLCKHMPAMVVGNELYELYSGCSTNVFKISPSIISSQDIAVSRKASLPKNGISGREISLLFVGRVEPEKGLRYLFEALAILNAKEKKSYSLTVVGAAQRGSKEKELSVRNSARQFGIDKRIEWVGYVPFGNELMDIYRRADIFVLPSLAEGIPKVLYEAMAAGLPIITTRIGGIPEIISDGVNGVLVSKGSVKGLVESIRKVSGDRSFRLKIGNAAIQNAERYTMEKARDHFIEVLKRVGIISS